MTDTKILKTLISNSNVKIAQESAREWESAKDTEEFPAIKNVTIDVLSKSFTKYLTYKISPEAYQRYSVRLNIIETLRDWSRIKWDFSELAVFQNLESSFEFLSHTLQKYLSDQNISSCDDVDSLVQLAEVLHNSEHNKKLCQKYFTKVVERITNLNQSPKSERFLRNLLENSDNFKIESSLIEKLYIKPLEACISDFYLDKTKEDNFKKIDFIFEKVIDSPSLFYLISNHLKNLFVKTKYAEKSQVFIKKMMEEIELFCNKHNKDTLDLYPTNLQFCVLLLRIKPCYHDNKSRNLTVQALKQIFLEDNNNALLLVSQFPEWLPDYLKFFDILEELSQKPDTQGVSENLD
ncbi:uncharacterized protein LOC106647882 [Copidosoma floridanum]|uniref:uncharacterized protein LOC106647882 n=1 Tax=Copidosoma floridanum TaxID=29053 RepID=UPI0006C9A0E2|nr:uncharacterized protein LOC106647882 [Copidosoma floridanum]